MYEDFIVSIIIKEL